MLASSYAAQRLGSANYQRVPKGGRRSRAVPVRAEAMGLSANPLYQKNDIYVQTMQNESLSIGAVTEGKTVVAMLRHLGCPFCWEFARQLKALEPRFEECGYKLVVLSVGSVEGGKKFCEAVPFPEDKLYLDADRKVYRYLQFYEGLDRTFLNPATPMALLKRDLGKLLQDVAGYQLIMPPNNDDVFQQGGFLIVDGDKVLLAHRDQATSDHPEEAALLGACCSGDLVAT